MRQISILYNSRGFIDIRSFGNASEERILAVLRKALRVMEHRAAPQKVKEAQTQQATEQRPPVPQESKE